ncbi:MAG: acyltransferase [Archangium sp.]|nr:acyltransferase [Archangium sp.]
MLTPSWVQGAELAGEPRVYLDPRTAGLSGLARKALLFVVNGLRVPFVLRGVQRLGRGVRVRGHAPIIQNVGGTIELGAHVFFDAPLTAAYLDVEPGALLSIGDDAYLHDNVWIGATRLVKIGERALIAPGVRIMDNAYHDLHDRHARPPSRPVVIEDDVWIAFDSLIGPGVHIGRGAVVGAHSIVTSDVRPFSVVAGAPAREIRQLDRAAFERSRLRPRAQDAARPSVA